MTEKKYTFLELHLHDGVQMAIGEQLGLLDTAGDSSEDEATDGRMGCCSGRTVLVAFVALLVLVAVVLVARKVVGTDLEAAEELDALGD